MKELKIKIEITDDKGEVYCSQSAGEVPSKGTQAEPYTLNGENDEEVLKKVIVMAYMVAAVAAENDRKLPIMFDYNNKNITLPNPFFQVA